MLIPPPTSCRGAWLQSPITTRHLLYCARDAERQTPAARGESSAAEVTSGNPDGSAILSHSLRPLLEPITACLSLPPARCFPIRLEIPTSHPRSGCRPA